MSRKGFVMSDVRVRFAPSPTGYLHIGGARTALFNALFAKQNGGTFILRIEDTDQERSTEEALTMQISDLTWLGLHWDEGPDPDTLEDRGDFGPYRQSRRLDIYREMIRKLLKEEKAYCDFRSEEELQQLKEAQQGEYFRIPRPSAILTLDKAQERLDRGEEAVVRFKVPEAEDFVFNDLVRGEIRLPSHMVGDFVLMRSTGMPVYNFCCAVDDATMKISHVFRAEEHLSNTLRQMMITDALGFDRPQYGHFSLILGEDRQKLSKRHGATSCHQFKESGFLPDAMVNYMALLGWSPKGDQEIFNRQDLEKQFSVDRINPSGAIFDLEKLKWVNATHLRELPDDELWKRLEPFFADKSLNLPSDPKWRSQALGTFKVAMETLADVDRFVPIDDQHFHLSEEGKEVLGWETTTDVLKKWKQCLSDLKSPFPTEDDFKGMQNQVKEAVGVKGKNLFMPLRVAVIGQPKGADMAQLVPLLSVESLLHRVETCLNA